MFHLVNAATGDEAYRTAGAFFATGGIARDQMSRLGRTLEVPRVAISIADPRQRYVFSRSPAINPAFAIAEVVWILTGRDDSAFLNFFNRSLPKFSGSTSNYHGAYGKRLRHTFGVDQLVRSAEVLRTSKESRQVVLQIWDATTDLPTEFGIPSSCDIPCNVSSMLKIRDNRLEWTQILRSNDLFRGLPYNFVQFMAMQEILSGWIGVEPGCYCHLSDSLHVYASDQANLSLSESAGDIPTPMSFNLGYEDSMESLSRIADHIDDLLEQPQEPIDFVKRIDSSKLPCCYRNMLCVLYAEAARRLHEAEQVERIMRRCECEALSQLMQRWLARMQPTFESPMTAEEAAST